ncbi:MAG: FISUMP domain-containing protein [Bacteroidales bacterium]
MKRLLITFIFSICLAGMVYPQKEAILTVLRNNTDQLNKKLYLEFMYEHKDCFDKAVARFWIVTPTESYQLEVEKVLNNTGNYTLSSDKKEMSDFKVGGYRVQFDISNFNFQPTDNVKLKIESFRETFKCFGCTPEGGDLIFDANDVAADCPYNINDGDLLACSRRTNGNRNWEIYIVDHRDCKPYKAVQMPDNRWWLAQNLNYQGYRNKKLIFTEDANNTASVRQSNIINQEPLNTFWCPGGTPSNGTTNIDETRASISTIAACQRYGALYPWTVAMTNDGYATSLSDKNRLRATQFVSPSIRRGICPEGWLLPSSFDWGKMLNLVERNGGLTECNADGSNIVGGGTHLEHACHHNPSGAVNSWAASQYSFVDLLSNNLAPAIILDNTGIEEDFETHSLGEKREQPNTLRIFANDNSPVWSYFSEQSKGTDKYGFNIHPAGVRYYDPNTNSPPTIGTFYFYHRGEATFFWTATSLQPEHSFAEYNFAHARGFRYNINMPNFPATVGGFQLMKFFGHSVRCVK